MMYIFFKRIVDIVISFFCIISISPFFCVVFILIKFNSKGPIIFTQKRIGLNYKPFTIYKLRTMKVNKKRILSQTYLDDDEIFPIGKLLRRYKLDELPQIFNILIGDMSLIGPRPCLESTIESMPKWALKRFEIKPGITGLAQVSGNTKLNWPQRWALDIDYINNQSFILDIKIIFSTLFVLLFGEKIKGVKK